MRPVMLPEEQAALERKVNNMTEVEFQEFLRRRGQAQHDLVMFNMMGSQLPWLIIISIILCAISGK